MLVEDEEFILQGILCIVDWKTIDMEVAYTAHNGKEALEKFREDPVDIIVTDVEMPLMDGLELIREIRKSNRRVRCLILSGYDEFEYARTALSLDAERIFGEIQNQIESESGIMTFLAAGNGIHSYEELPESYQSMNHLLRYRIMTGWGRCVSAQSIARKGNTGINVDLAYLRKKILEKDQDGALQYLEEVFVGLVESGSDIDAVYQNALKVVLLLQDIKSEYKISDSKTVRSLTEIFDHIYQVEDIAGMRTVLVLEISAVIMALHTEDSHYTPVIREILSYIQVNYKEDLSLKILSYKYHMNASYLGQIFQKEVGCSFNQYLSNLKNEKAKDMILNTNMKINDIAKEVGYLDTSYFYRKFKQCYGVSPASLRGMKKY